MKNSKNSFFNLHSIFYFKPLLILMMEAKLFLQVVCVYRQNTKKSLYC